MLCTYEETCNDITFLMNLSCFSLDLIMFELGISKSEGASRYKLD